MIGQIVVWHRYVTFSVRFCFPRAVIEENVSKHQRLSTKTAQFSLYHEKTIKGHRRCQITFQSCLISYDIIVEKAHHAFFYWVVCFKIPQCHSQLTTCMHPQGCAKQAHPSVFSRFMCRRARIASFTSFHFNNYSSPYQTSRRR